MSSLAQSTFDPVLHHYEYLAELSGKMLKCAQDQNWPAVVSIGQQYQKAVEALRSVSSAKTTDTEACHTLLTQILRDDARLRELAMPELARLSNIMGSLKRQQSLHQAYGPHQAS